MSECLSPLPASLHSPFRTVKSDVVVRSCASACVYAKKKKKLKHKVLGEGAGALLNGGKVGGKRKERKNTFK